MQTCGIPQGAATSPLLCRLYMRHIAHTTLLPALHSSVTDVGDASARAAGNGSEKRSTEAAQPGDKFEQTRGKQQNGPGTAVPSLLMHIADDFLLLVADADSSSDTAARAFETEGNQERCGGAQQRAAAVVGAGLASGIFSQGGRIYMHPSPLHLRALNSHIQLHDFNIIVWGSYL